MEPLGQKAIRAAFNDPNLYFFNDSDRLASFIKGLDLKDTNLLLMSSGNFGNMDLVKLACELNT
jgi:UDP-N-acetylmuramate: L-alanyl-gamma-D-glutamyl-meso-diaminopimelate ligase